MIEVFVQNEAGLALKHSYNEKTLQYQGRQRVSRPYPYPYGFILNTSSDDGDNLDCFLLIERALARGSIILCEPMGLLEQLEDRLVDHNVLAVPAGESLPIDERVLARLRDFILHVFDHVPNKQISVGQLLSKQDAIDYIASHIDSQ